MFSYGGQYLGTTKVQSDGQIITPSTCPTPPPNFVQYTVTNNCSSPISVQYPLSGTTGYFLLNPGQSKTFPSLPAASINGIIPLSGGGSGIMYILNNNNYLLNLAIQGNTIIACPSTPTPSPTPTPTPTPSSTPTPSTPPSPSYTPPTPTPTPTPTPSPPYTLILAAVAGAALVGALVYSERKKR
ncbi:MAG: hypothetical protein QW750_06255 [Zestosphaera sp.]